jgi:CRP-like cAMP-binding protein
MASNSPGLRPRSGQSPEFRRSSPAEIGNDGKDRPSFLANRILANLPERELDALLDASEQISSGLREIYFEDGDDIDFVYFPLTGLGSLVTVLKDGTSLEAMTVGREGFIGLPVFHGIGTARCRAMCQVDGDFYRIAARDFQRLTQASPGLSSAIHRYAQYAHEVLAQSAACNSVHLLEQRCARWLLSTCEGVGRVQFNLTQEFLAQMLAVRRTGVTVAMGALERQGLVSHRYGKVSILDRKGLEKVSCECYRTISEKARQLIS